MIQRRTARAGSLPAAIGPLLMLALAQPAIAQEVRPGPMSGDNVTSEVEFARRMGQAVRLANTEHKIPEAIAEVEAALASIRGRPGGAAERESQALELLAQLHSANRDLWSRQRVLRELIAVRSNLLGPDHWSLTDLKFSALECERLAAMDEETRRLYFEAAQEVNRGYELANKRSFEAAIVLLEQARVFYRERWDRHPDHATCLYFLGVVHRERRQYTRARGFLDQALAMRREILTERHPRTIESWNALARLYEAEGDLARARRLFQHALALHEDVWKLERKRLNQAEHSNRALQLERLAHVLRAEGDLAGAADVLAQAVAARAELAEALASAPNMGPGPAGVRPPASAPPGPGGTRPSAIQTPGARSGDDEENDSRSPPSAYGLRRGRLTPHSVPKFNALMDTEDEMAMIRNPTHPWSLRKRAWYMYRLTIEGSPQNLGLSGVLDKQDWIARAIEGGVVRGDPWIDFALSLGLLADVLRARVDLTRSRQVRLLSLAVGLEATDPSDATAGSFARFLEDFDALLIDLGELDLAQGVALMSVRSRRSSLGDRHPDYAAALETLAVVLWREGDLTQAMLVLERALAVRRSAEGDRHPDLAADLDRLALLHAEQGDPSEAQRYASEALAVHESLIERTLPSLPERVRLALLAQSSRSLTTFLDLTASEPSMASEAYRHLIAWKGIATEAAAAQATAARSPRLRALTDDLNLARDELSRLYHAVVPPAQAGEHAQRIAEQARRRDDLEARLAEALGWKPHAPRPGDVAAALPAASVLVDIARYVRRIPPTPEEVESRRRTARDAHYQVNAPAMADARYEPRYVAFVVRPGRESPERIDLGPAEPIDRAINQWLEKVENRKDERDLEATGRLLRRLLWEPLAPALGPATRVLLSPDGLLNFLPWGALPGQAPGTYLLSERAFATVIAARQLVAGRQTGSKVAGGLLAVGDVNYGEADDGRAAPRVDVLASRTRSAPVTGESLHFERLEKTGAEAIAVEKLFRTYVGADRTLGAVLLTAEKATKRRTLEAIQSARFLHLATHGYFARLQAPADPVPDTGVTPSQAGAESPDDAPALFPGLLSGLVFAGANRPQSDPLTDSIDVGAGIMTAEEVAGLDLSTCELAVLSACETGRGRVTGGEGVIGLQRAFQAAGARTVVGSLWNVDDEATRVLMTYYYENLWRRRLGPLEALRQAQLKVLTDGTASDQDRRLGPTERKSTAVSVARVHPRYWAAWVLSGDPGAPPSAQGEQASLNPETSGTANRATANRWPIVAVAILLAVASAPIAWLWMNRARRRPP
jgi:CHAT domain-containing protein